MNLKNVDAFTVSVIVRTYCGRNHLLSEAVKSIGSQTYRPIELIVIEDGSQEAEAYVISLRGSERFSQVIYQSVPKLGRSHAGNVGLAVASGAAIAFLDDDDLFFPEHLEILVNELRGNSEYAAVYSLALQASVDQQGREIRRDLIYRQAFSRKLLWCRNYLPIQSVLFRRELYEKYGGFSEHLEQLEDWELWIRYSLENEFHLVKKITSVYRVPHDTTIAWERQKKLDASYSQIVESMKKLKIRLTPRWYLYVLLRRCIKKNNISFKHFTSILSNGFNEI